MDYLIPRNIVPHFTSIQYLSIFINTMLEFSNNDILHSCIELLRAILPNAVSEAKSRKEAFNIAKQEEMKELSKIYGYNQCCFNYQFSKISYDFVKPWADRYYKAQDCKKEYVIELYQNAVKTHIEIQYITPLHSCHFLPVYYLSNGNKKIISPTPILYRWWFAEDSEPVKIIQECFLHGAKIDDYFLGVKTREIEGKRYYALYFGKSINGYQRFNVHINGNVKTSTLRKTIAGLCCGDLYNKSIEKDKITPILKECYFEWIDFPEDEEIVDVLETLCITTSCYPLNIDSNSSLNEEWVKILLAKRKPMHISKAEA